MTHRLLLCATTAALLASSSAKADDLFSVTANSTTGVPTSVRASGSTIVELVEDLVDTRGQFQALNGRGYNAALNYAGIGNAIEIDRNAAGTSATLRIPSTGLVKTFTGDDADDLEDQITDYLKKDGAAEFGQFLAQVNRLTFVGVTDGNPLATTALAASGAYRRFGFEPTPFLNGNAKSLGGGGELRFDIDGGIAQTDDGDGYFAGGTISGKWRFTDHVALSLASPLSYREVEGADVFNLGFELGLPITFFTGARGPVRWTLTPAGVAYVGGSYDLAAGGILAGGSLTSSLTYAFENIGLAFTLANQIGLYEGVPITVDEYEFDTTVSQQILKNGIKATKTIGRKGFVDAGITHTDFLDDAAVDNYLTPTLGGGLMFGTASGVRLAYQGDFADGYTAHGGTLQLWFTR